MTNVNALEISDGDIGVASSHLTGNADTIARAFGMRKNDSGLWIPGEGRESIGKANFVSTKTTNGYATRGDHADPDCPAHCKEQEDRRIAVLRGENGVSALNSETSFPYNFEEYLAMIECALELGKPLMISVGYEVDQIDKTIRAIKEITQHYPDCPVSFELSLHHAKDRDVVKNRIEAAVKAAGEYPLFVKISYYGGHYLEIAKMAVEECGARGIIGINSLGPFDDINDVLAEGDSGWLSGKLIEGVSQEICRQVVESVCDPRGVPYVAVGGVDPRNILKYFELGANAVASCTYLMGIGINRGLSNLRRNLKDDLGERNVSDIRGTKNTTAVVPNLGEEVGALPEQVSILTRRHPRVGGLDRPLAPSVSTDDRACTGCGICADACAEGAITVEGTSRVARINEETCERCGACVGACRRGSILYEK